MLVKTILNRIQKYKSFIYKDCKFVEGPSGNHIEIRVEARKNSKVKCPRCEKSSSTYDHLPERHYEFVPLWGIKVFLIYRPRRSDCKGCDSVLVERVPWSDGKHQLTNTFRIFLSRWARKLSWKEASEIFHVSWEHVYRSIQYVVGYGLKHRSLDGVTAIGIDEIKYKVGHKYLTLVYQLNEGKRRLLYVGKDRKAKTLLRFFVDIGRKRCNQILAVCTDMWDPYLKVIAKKLPLALNILDRFHIKKHLNDAVDNVRKQESALLRIQGYEPVLEKSRWPLLKNEENLTDTQHVKLRELLKYNLKSVKSYLLKKEFDLLWKYKSPYWAERFMNNWTYKTMRSRIKPMKKFAKTIRRYQPLILNWFRVKGALSSGPVEGLNAKAKLTMRKAYGFREYNVLKMALFHQLGALPEPEYIHKF